MERLRGKCYLQWRDRKLSSVPVAAGFCLLLLWLAVAPARAASFTASLDNDTLTLGQSATLTLTFEGGSPKNITVPTVPGLQINSSQNFSYSFSGGFGVTGNSTISISYSVTPQRAGEFTIPALTADVDGVQLASLPLSLKVVQPSAASAAQIDSGSQMAFAKLSLPADQVYAGEVIAADLQLYYRQDAQLTQQPQLTGVSAEGFTVGKIAAIGQSQAQIGNTLYHVISAKIPLTVSRTGRLRVGPVSVNLVLAVSSNNRSNDPFFRQFGMRDPFGNFDYEQKQVSLATETVNVQSLPLPAENVPPNFNGAIGQYTMTVTAGPTNVAVGDPITVRIQIAGRGDLGALTLPEQPAWHDFTVYPPTARVVTTDPAGLQGAKTFEEIVAPQNTDVHELPPFSFSYFDPDAGSYRLLTEPSVALAVRSAGTPAVPTIAARTATAENPTPPADILPIKDELGALAPAGPPLVTRPAFLAVQALPVLAFLAALVWRKRTDQLANNPRLRRERAVAALIASGLDGLKKYAAENRPDEFFATLFRLLQEQLGERLDCPASAITENVIDEHPVLRGAPKTTLDGLRELFQLCNQARYAPVRGTGELNSVAAQFEKVISQLQELKA